MQIRQKVAVAKQYFDDKGRCLYCDLVQAEVEAKARLVRVSEPFVVFHPFASHAPFETWIALTQHQSSFGHASRGELAALARVLKKTLQALADALGDPDFNLILHTAPVADETQPYYLWHLQIIPRVTTIAGFELGSGMATSTIKPEETAAIMRDGMPT
jgi:UDPglucose--hexose-1-phosphate uridylyltransferase